MAVVGKSVGAGACANVKRQNELYEISDETPIICLLSVEDDPEQGYDWLYIVMKDIVCCLFSYSIYTVDGIYCTLL